MSRAGVSLGFAAAAALTGVAAAWSGSAGATTEPPEGALAAIDGRVMALSPDGSRVAGVGPDRSVCVWSATGGDAVCSDPDLDLPVGPAESPAAITWSPAGDRIAFQLDWVIEAQDSDIHVMDAASGDVIALTDDGYAGSLFADAPHDLPLDAAPAWSPDGSEIAFVRYVADDPPALMRIAADGGDPEMVIGLVGLPRFSVYMPLWWDADGVITFSVQPVDRDDPSAGIYRVGADGQGLEQVVASGGDVTLAGLSAQDVAGSTISLSADDGRRRFGSAADGGGLFTVDASDGEVAPLPSLDLDGAALLPLSPLAFESESSGVAVYGAADPPRAVLARVDLEAGTGEVVTTVPPPAARATPQVAENGAILVGAGSPSPVLVSPSG